MKEYKLTEEEQLTVMAVKQQADQAAARFERAFQRLAVLYGKEAGITKGVFNMRGPDLFLVEQTEEEQTDG